MMPLSGSFCFYTTVVQILSSKNLGNCSFFKVGRKRRNAPVFGQYYPMLKKQKHLQLFRTIISLSKERKGRRFFLSFACVKSKYNGEIRDEKERTESWKKYSNLSEILFCLRYGFIFRKAIGRNTYPPHPLFLERCMYPRETTDDPPTSRHVLYIFYIYIYINCSTACLVRLTTHLTQWGLQGPGLFCVKRRQGPVRKGQA